MSRSRNNEEIIDRYDSSSLDDPFAIGGADEDAGLDLSYAVPQTFESGSRTASSDSYRPSGMLHTSVFLRAIVDEV